MPNLGTIGRTANLNQIGAIQSFPGPVRVVNLGGERYITRLTEDSTEGNPTAPSMKICGPHRHQFRWGVAAGTRTISVDVKYSPDSGSGKRPQLVVKANTDIGVNADQTSEAPSGSGWVTIGPITVNPTSDGALSCELRYDHHHLDVQVVNWDNIEVT